MEVNPEIDMQEGGAFNVSLPCDGNLGVPLSPLSLFGHNSSPLSLLVLKASTNNEEIFHMFWELEGTVLLPLMSMNTLPLVSLECEFALHFEPSAIPKAVNGDLQCVSWSVTCRLKMDLRILAET